MVLGFGDLRFPFTQITIDFETVQRYQEYTPRRICFSTTRKNALKRSTDLDYAGTFNIPFGETINPIFNEATKLEMFPAKQFGGFWRSVSDDAEFKVIEEFINNVQDIVFLRDTLSLSVALSEYLEDDERTEVGELEHQAKYNRDEDALKKLAELCVHTMLDILPYYKTADMICPVPASTEKTFHLPSLLVQMNAPILEIENISSVVTWENPKPSLKGLQIEQKWPALEKANLIIKKDLSNKAIIIVDDLYQSGITMQYVAMKLLEAGANKLFGLALVKSRSNTDNL